MRLSSCVAALTALLAFTCTTSAQVRKTSGKIVVPASSVESADDVGLRAHTNLRLFVPTQAFQNTQPSGPPYAGYGYETPASLSCVYKLVKRTGTNCVPDIVRTVPAGGSRTISIVTAYDAPTASADLVAFSKQFGLPSPNFQKVYATGVQPGNDPGWELQTSLAIEWAHAMAPNAKIILVEAASNSYADLVFAVGVASQSVAAQGGGEISLGWGGSEFTSQTSLDSTFATAGIVYVAAAGDDPGLTWPGSSPNVVSVGGSTIRRNWNNSKYIEEVPWDVTGGGPSDFEARPAYQNAIAPIVGNFRGVPDIASVSNPTTGVWVLDSNQNGWYVAGGTSVAASVMTGIVNSAGSFYSSSAAELSVIYTNSADGTMFHDIKWGYCGFNAGYTNAKGYDFCSGVGSASGLLGK